MAADLRRRHPSKCLLDLFLDQRWRKISFVTVKLPLTLLQIICHKRCLHSSGSAQPTTPGSVGNWWCPSMGPLLRYQRWKTPGLRARSFLGPAEAISAQIRFFRWKAGPGLGFECVQIDNRRTGI